MHDYPPILAELGRGMPVRLEALGGGCIAAAAVAIFDDGSKVFLKRAAGDPRMFKCEAQGLELLAQANCIRVPEVIAVSETALVLEYIAQGTPGAGFFEQFGRQFARLHQMTADDCGLDHDNFIGSTSQHNGTVNGGWSGFFIEQRLRFQTDLANDNGLGDELALLLDKAEPRIEQMLANDEPPGLLHGDLWGGNFLVDEYGAACLIDPAVYFGHREADLAMTRLFGGFDTIFYAAYDEALPLTPGWEERLPIYQLYHLLNHLNLFGSAYYSRCRQILENLAN